MESFMKDINFVKNIDNLGRIVIPMDIRRKLKINTGDILSITCNDKNILLTKYSNLDNNYKVIEIIKNFIEIFNVKIIFTNKNNVIFSNIVDIGDTLDKEFLSLVNNAASLKAKNMSFVFGTNKVSGIYNVVPIVTNEGIEGSIVVFDDNQDNAYNIGVLISRLLQLELNIS